MHDPLLEPIKFTQQKRPRDPPFFPGAWTFVAFFYRFWISPPIISGGLSAGENHRLHPLPFSVYVSNKTAAASAAKLSS